MSIKEQLATFHHPELITNPEGGDGNHVCQIWEDGEVTLTKGGSLYGQRNLHMIEFGHGMGLPLDVMPMTNSKHGYVVVRYADHKAVRDLIIATIEGYASCANDPVR